MDVKLIQDLAKEVEGEIIEYRRDLHAHPELSWKEERTSKVIESVLVGLGSH